MLRRQSLRDSQIVLQSAIHTGHDVADDLRGGVPDAKLLAQFRIEGF